MPCPYYLTVVLCGDNRLQMLFRQEDLVPLASRKDATGLGDTSECSVTEGQARRTRRL